MKDKDEKYKTSDLALAAYLICSGIQLLGIDSKNPRRCIFIFNHSQSNLITEWQEGKAVVNGLAYHKALRELRAMISRGVSDA